MATHRTEAVDPAVAARQNRQANRRPRAYEYRSPSIRNRTHSWVMINAETKLCKSVAPSEKRTVHPRPIVLQIPSLESWRAPMRGRRLPDAGRYHDADEPVGDAT